VTRSEGGAATPGGTGPGLRADKWLWQARLFRSRSLAAATAGSGRMRLNGERVAKPAQPVRVGDTLTFPQGGRIRVVRITALGSRRGPAAEAQALYVDLTPEPEAAPASGAPQRVAGRPPRDARRAARLRKGGAVE